MKSFEDHTAQQRLEERVQHLETVVEGLQDAVDRESRRFDTLIEALERKTDPAEMARLLGEDARRRGL